MMTLCGIWYDLVYAFYYMMQEMLKRKDKKTVGNKLIQNDKGQNKSLRV